MEQDYKLEVNNEYFNKNNHSGLRWFITVKFDNGDEIKVPFKQYDSIKGTKVDEHINKYRLKKRKDKINKIINGKNL